MTPEQVSAKPRAQPGSGAERGVPVPLEADEADVLEQTLIVDLDDDDDRR